jgi:pimeloyl-ACP methyl ester carboxylesterase
LRWIASWLCLFLACSPPARAPATAEADNARVEESPRSAAISSETQSPRTSSPSLSASSGNPETATAPPIGDLDNGPHVTVLAIADVPPPILVLPHSNQSTPLLIGAHGAGGSPEWQCDWLSSLRTTPTALLCLRGLPLARGELTFYYPEHHSLGRWLAAALERVTGDHGSRLASPFIYVGYSQGATMGALAIQTAKTVIPNLLLVEGGLEGWTLARSRAFARAGGRKIYFACGTRSCNAKAHKLLLTLTDAGIEARLGYAEGAGHTPLGAVERCVREGLGWLLNESAEPSAQL